MGYSQNICKVSSTNVSVTRNNNKIKKVHFLRIIVPFTRHVFMFLVKS